MKEYLGVMFERRDDGTFVLSQRQYLLNILQRFGIVGFQTLDSFEGVNGVVIAKMMFTFLFE
jgi:hypothetical protein